MPRVKNALAIELAKDCRTIEDIQEKLKDLFKDTIQQIFEAEMDHHLGYPKNDPEGNNTGNSRNGYSNKTVKTRAGETELEIEVSPLNRTPLSVTTSLFHRIA